MIFFRVSAFCSVFGRLPAWIRGAVASAVGVACCECGASPIRGRSGGLCGFCCFLGGADGFGFQRSVRGCGGDSRQRGGRRETPITTFPNKKAKFYHQKVLTTPNGDDRIRGKKGDEANDGQRSIESGDEEPQVDANDVGERVRVCRAIGDCESVLQE